MTESINLAMTPGEIKTSYMQAANRKAQIGVLADLNACSKQDIKDVLKAIGAPVDDEKYHKWTAEEDARLKELLEAGCSQKEIGEQMGLRATQIHSRLSLLGLTEKKRRADGEPKPERPVSREENKPKEEAEERLQAMFDKAMAQETGTSITVPANATFPQSGNSPDLPLAATSKEKREQKSWTPEEEELLLKLVAEGRDHQEIGEALHRSAGSIKHKLKHIRAVGLKAKAGEFQPPAETSRRLSVAEFNGMVSAAIGQELDAGAEARLVDMLSALGYMVMQYFAADQR